MNALIRLARPKQWTKNSLVFAAIIFAHEFFDVQAWISSLLTFFAFSLVASGIYVINDLLDVEIDRLHPKKKDRPIASGEVKPPAAIIFAIILLSSGLALGLSRNLWTLLILVGYILVMIAYSIRLKHVMMLDVFIIAIGLTARAIIGGVAIDVPVSTWLQVCTFFIALMLALVKRRQELSRLGDHIEQKGRKSLRNAPDVRVWDLWISMVAGITILAYTLYTVDADTVSKFGSGGLLYSVPFVAFAVMRYQIAVYSEDKGEDPTETLLQDKWILFAIFLWLLVVLAVII
ncbi:decaprenyl-phosphate phosphoribosyltransferase [bacterium]|nr:decaprenyl-phosphate phosphoribosyltransferase [bacterium]